MFHILSFSLTCYKMRKIENASKDTWLHVHTLTLSLLLTYVHITHVFSICQSKWDGKITQQ